MVIEFFGLPGSGKTSALTMVAQQALRGRSVLGLGTYTHVYTTYQCAGCCKLNFSALGKYDFTDSLLIIDEISLYADNRNFKSFSADLLYFFKLHRHYHVDVIWCSQSFTDADKKIRDVTDTAYLIEPWFFGITHLKPLVKYFDMSFGKVAEGVVVAPMSRWVWCYRPKYYKYFDSYSRKSLPAPVLEYWDSIPTVIDDAKKLSLTSLISSAKSLIHKD